MGDRASMFSHARDVTVTGGNFYNLVTVHQTGESIISKFYRGLYPPPLIPMGVHRTPVDSSELQWTPVRLSWHRDRPIFQVPWDSAPWISQNTVECQWKPGEESDGVTLDWTLITWLYDKCKIMLSMRIEPETSGTVVIWVIYQLHHQSLCI